MQNRYTEVLPMGVGLYEKTPASERKVGIAYTTWHRPEFPRWGKGTWVRNLYFRVHVISLRHLL